MCRAFVAVQDKRGEASEHLPDAARMVTIWAVKNGSAVSRSDVVSSPAEADRLCAAAATSYDHLRAQ